MHALLGRGLFYRGIGPELCLFHQTVGLVLEGETVLNVSGNGVVSLRPPKPIIPFGDDPDTHKARTNDYPEFCKPHRNLLINEGANMESKSVELPHRGHLLSWAGCTFLKGLSRAISCLPDKGLLLQKLLICFKATFQKEDIRNMRFLNKLFDVLVVLTFSTTYQHR